MKFHYSIPPDLIAYCNNNFTAAVIIDRLEYYFSIAAQMGRNSFLKPITGSSAIVEHNPLFDAPLQDDITFCCDGSLRKYVDIVISKSLYSIERNRALHTVLWTRNAALIERDIWPLYLESGAGWNFIPTDWAEAWCDAHNVTYRTKKKSKHLSQEHPPVSPANTPSGGSNSDDGGKPKPRIKDEHRATIHALTKDENGNSTIKFWTFDYIEANALHKKCSEAELNARVHRAITAFKQRLENKKLPAVKKLGGCFNFYCKLEGLDNRRPITNSDPTLLSKAEQNEALALMDANDAYLDALGLIELKLMLDLSENQIKEILDQSTELVDKPNGFPFQSEAHSEWIKQQLIAANTPQKIGGQK